VTRGHVDIIRESLDGAKTMGWVNPVASSCGLRREHERSSGSQVASLKGVTAALAGPGLLLRPGPAGSGRIA